MTTIDFHFHANIHGISRSSTKERLKKYSHEFERLNIDYIVSTEHSYKNPLKAYLSLSEATQCINTTIIPGIESVSKEGIDIIYIFRNRKNLKQALSTLKSFSWSINDIDLIQNDLETITVVPHPFFISKTSYGNILGIDAYLKMLSLIDYVEIHNGSALNADKLIRCAFGDGSFVKDKSKRISWTLNLPQQFRGDDLGWAVGSDAHSPDEIFVVGSTEEKLRIGEDIFDFLKRRIQFSPVELESPPERIVLNAISLMRSLRFAFAEYCIKKRLKVIQAKRSIW